jgi:hypothetical protein
MSYTATSLVLLLLVAVATAYNPSAPGHLHHLLQRNRMLSLSPLEAVSCVSVGCGSYRHGR